MGEWSHVRLPKRCDTVKKINNNDVYKFGYLEISAQYPDTFYPLWPVFWLWSAYCPLNFYNEIDICENGAAQSQDGHIVGTNVHVNTASCNYQGNTDIPGPITVSPLISSGFHKYAVKWEPHSITWYFDDTPIRYLYDADGDSIPQNAMAVILNLSVDPWWAMLPTDWNNDTLFPNNPQHTYIPPVQWPKEFKIDYLRYYKLGTECNSNLIICNPSDYNRKVKRSISTNSSCSPLFNPSTANASYTLRATDYIILDGGATINPSGAGYFAVEITACPQ